MKEIEKIGLIEQSKKYNQHIVKELFDRLKPTVDMYKSRFELSYANGGKESAHMRFVGEEVYELITAVHDGFDFMRFTPKKLHNIILDSFDELGDLHKYIHAKDLIEMTSEERRIAKKMYKDIAAVYVDVLCIGSDELHSYVQHCQAIKSAAVDMAYRIGMVNEEGSKDA